MEPALIYAASGRLKNRVNWAKVSPDTEWIYFGAENDVKEEIAFQEISQYFHGLPVMIAIDRTNSATIKADDVQRFLNRILGFKDFHIWDQSFRRIMEFSRIGVLRKGII